MKGTKRNIDRDGQNKRTDRPIDRHTDRQTDKPTDRQTNI